MNQEINDTINPEMADEKSIEKLISDFLPESEYRGLLRNSDPYLNLLVSLVEKRFIDIENKIYSKKGRQLPDLPEKMLIMHKLGIIDFINQLPTQQQHKAELLSLLIEENRDNVEKALHNMKDENPRLRKAKTYKYVFEKFQELGLKPQANEVETVYKSILEERKG